MNTETLERLMLDRSLGALPPDCEALLAAYLEKDPAATRASQEFNRAVALARGALADQARTALPAFPAEQMMQADRRIRISHLGRLVAGTAAAALIGFASHAMLFQAGPTAPAQPGVMMADAASFRPAATTPESEHTFWSARRLYEHAASKTPQPSARVNWTSPVTAPEIGGAT